MGNPTFGVWLRDDDPADGEYGPEASCGYEGSVVEADILAAEEEGEGEAIKELRELARNLRKESIQLTMSILAEACDEHSWLSGVVTTAMIKKILLEAELGLI